MTSPRAATTDRALLEDLYRTAIRAVDPGPAVTAALSAGGVAGDARGSRLFIIALGKASLAMATGAATVARSERLDLAGGLIVGSSAGQGPDPALPMLAGDHPEPGAASQAASDRLGQLAAQVRPGDHVWVLLSGGATSLIGAPVDGVHPGELRELYRILLGSGLDINAMNRVRKRFTRWGGGKLAAALSGAVISQFVVSDVIGDDLLSIGSGPLIGDPATAAEIRAMFAAPGLEALEPLRTLHDFLAETEAGRRAETPKPDHPSVASVRTTIVSSNRLALEAASGRAAALGLAPHMVATPLAGEARSAGASVAATLRNYSQSPTTQGAGLRSCFIWGGETTVTLGDSHGLGGRSQELALAAAETMAGTTGCSVLAAGTDGRDGPTDAAGAVVDGGTWKRIAAAGLDPARELAAHNAYAALDAAGALFRPGLTGTNVMDLVIGLAGP